MYPVRRGRDWQIQRVHWPTSVGKLVSSKFNMKTLEHAHTHKNTYLNTQTQIQTHTDTDTHLRNTVGVNRMPSSSRVLSRVWNTVK